MVVQLEGITKRFGDIVAVDSLSLEVPSGVVYGILGPNGAGKTTTLRVLLGILTPDAGRVRLMGRPVGVDILSKVGYLPEERGLYPKEKVLEVLTYLGELKGLSHSEARDRALSLLEEFGLRDRASAKVEELSKGMQQKLQFISVLLHDPELLILDEPFSGLDPINSEILREKILEERSRGKTVIFSTHILEQAEKMCDYVALISRGRKVVDGKLTEIKAKYGKRTIKVEFEGDGEVFRQIPHTSLRLYERFAEIETDLEVNEVIKFLADKIKVYKIERTEPSLSQIYISLVGGEGESLDNN